MIFKSGRWGHRPRRIAAVGVPTNRKMENFFGSRSPKKIFHLEL